MFTLSPRKLKYFWFWREQRKLFLVLLSPWRCRRAENYGAKAPYIQEKAVYCKTGTNPRRSIVHRKIIVLIKLRIIIPPILNHRCATTLQKSSKRSRVSAVFRDIQQSQDFAMSSLILPRLSRKTCRLRKKTTTSFKSLRETHSRIGWILSCQPIVGCSGS